MVYKFICGHYGRDSEPPVGCKRAKIRGFIRVAELRGERIEDAHSKCPDCKGR